MVLGAPNTKPKTETSTVGKPDAPKSDSSSEEVPSGEESSSDTADEA